MHVLHHLVLSIHIIHISNWQWVAKRELEIYYIYIACNIMYFFLSVGFTGNVSTAYLRTSFKSLDRLNASGLITSSNEELANDLAVLVCIIFRLSF